MSSYFQDVPEELVLQILSFIGSLTDLYNFSLFIHTIKDKYYINDKNICRYLLNFVHQVNIEGDYIYNYLRYIIYNFNSSMLDIPHLENTNKEYFFDADNLPDNMHIVNRFRILNDGRRTQYIVNLDSDQLYDPYYHRIITRDSNEFKQYNIIGITKLELNNYNKKMIQAIFKYPSKVSEYENKINIINASLKVLPKLFELINYFK